MSVTILTEQFTRELMTEMLPLAQACWDESSADKVKRCSFDGDRDIAVEPDVDTYLHLALKGNLILVAMREGKELVGFATAMLYHSMHHRRVLCACGDVFYVKPKYRGHASKLLAKVEEEFKAAGVVGAGWPCTIDGPVYKLLEVSGYKADDCIMEKRICALS